MATVQLSSRCKLPTLCVLVILSLGGCDQFSNRYEITKDQSGRTLRLDKRTGEVSIIEGERIAPIRDAKSVEAEKTLQIDELARAKTFPSVMLPNFGLEATLRTSWQDGKMLYAVSFGPMRKPKPSPSDEGKTMGDAPAKVATKIAPVEWNRFDRQQWFLILEDSPFELARQTLSFSNIVDESGKTTSKDAKGSIPMSSDTYKRIDLWNVMWRDRF